MLLVSEAAKLNDFGLIEMGPRAFWTSVLGRSTKEEFDFPLTTNLKLKLLLVKLEDTTSWILPPASNQPYLRYAVLVSRGCQPS